MGKKLTRAAVGASVAALLAVTLTACGQTPSCDDASAVAATTATAAGFSSGGRSFGGGSSFRSPSFRSPSFRAPSAPKMQRLNPAKPSTPKVSPSKPKPAPVKPKTQTVPAPTPQRAPEVHNHYSSGGGLGGMLGGLGLGWLIGQSGNSQGVCS